MEINEEKKCRYGYLIANVCASGYFVPPQPRPVRTQRALVHNGNLRQVTHGDVEVEQERAFLVPAGRAFSRISRKQRGSIRINGIPLFDGELPKGIPHVRK